MPNLTVQTIDSPDQLTSLMGYRPQARLHGQGDNQTREMVVNAAGFPQYQTARGLVVNSLLRKNEWERLDAAIVRRLHQFSSIDAAVERAGLLIRLGSLGVMRSEWNVASEKPQARAAMSTQTGGNQDRVDKKLYGVPVPVIFSDYTIDERELAASRLMGNDLETIEAEEAAQAVAEKIEDMWIKGAPEVSLGGSIPGLTTIAGRKTDTAASFGGGDFGTITNIEKTFVGVLGAMAANRYRGPFGVFVSPVQYYQMLAYFTDGSGETALQRVLRLPQISFVNECPLLADSHVVFVQLSSNVIDKAVALDVTSREWMSPDGSASHFRVIAAMTPRIKTDYAGNVGVAHVTSA